MRLAPLREGQETRDKESGAREPDDGICHVLWAREAASWQLPFRYDDRGDNSEEAVAVVCWICNEFVVKDGEDDSPVVSHGSGDEDVEDSGRGATTERDEAARRVLCRDIVAGGHG